jgi:hypothetical protein
MGFVDNRPNQQGRDALAWIFHKLRRERPKSAVAARQMVIWVRNVLSILEHTQITALNAVYVAQETQCYSDSQQNVYGIFGLNRVQPLCVVRPASLIGKCCVDGYKLRVVPSLRTKGSGTSFRLVRLSAKIRGWPKIEPDPAHLRSTSIVLDYQLFGLP